MHTSRGRTGYPVGRATPSHDPTAMGQQAVGPLHLDPKCSPSAACISDWSATVRACRERADRRSTASLSITFVALSLLKVHDCVPVIPIQDEKYRVDDSGGAHSRLPNLRLEMIEKLGVIGR